MQYEKNDIILEAQNVSKCFPIRGTMGRVVNHVKAVDNVSLTLRRGETYGLMGETGCGKSTLGRTLIALPPATQGSILIDGQEITAMRPGALRSLRRCIGDILMEVLAIQCIGRSREERQALVMETLAKASLRPEHFYRFPHEFSGGQRQRVGLARTDTEP